MSAPSIPFRNPVGTPAESDFIVVPHHFDRLRQPAEEPDQDAGVRVGRALTWNLFRALELLPPAFWLRRLRARLQDPNPGVPAPTLARVSLWKALEPSPALALTGADAHVVSDVVIETEFTVWTLLTLFGRDMRDDTGETVDQVMRTIDAGSWYAGAREYCFGLIVADPADAPHTISRVQHYARHRSHVTNRLPARSDGLRNMRAVGVARWRDVEEILEDGARSNAVTPIERAIAARAVEWLGATREHL